MYRKLFSFAALVALLCFAASSLAGTASREVPRSGAIVAGDDSLGTTAETTAALTLRGFEDSVKFNITCTESITVLAQYRPAGSSIAWMTLWALDTIPDGSVDTSHSFPMGLANCEYRFIFNDLEGSGVSDMRLDEVYSTP